MLPNKTFFSIGDFAVLGVYFDPNKGPAMSFAPKTSRNFTVVRSKECKKEKSEWHAAPPASSS